MKIPQKLSTTKAKKVLALCSIMLTITLSTTFLFDYWINNTQDGFNWMLQNKGYDVATLFHNYPIMGNWTQYPQIEVHGLTPFLQLNRQYSFYSISLHSWTIQPPIYPEIHYLDHHPFYDWWFCNGTHIFIWTGWRANQ
jgi:hypothetical protein